MSDPYSDEVRAWIVRASGASIFGDVLPLLANLNAVSPLPTEMLGDALLSIARDWYAMPARWPVRLVLDLEKANAAIIAAQREAAEHADSAASRPRGMSTPKRTHAGGRR